MRFFFKSFKVYTYNVYIQVEYLGIKILELDGFFFKKSNINSTLV